MDLLCLHLGFYLASWGMYHGSSFLLQKDYHAHTKVIQKLLQAQYLHLWTVTCEEYLHAPESIPDLISLSDELRVIYGNIRESVYASAGKPNPVLPVSDTLITKVMLGTLGCVPAYDSFFNQGIVAHKVASSICNEKSIKRLSAYYVENRKAFEDLRMDISNESIVYPQMKIIDMCFWQTGYNLDQQKQ